MERSPWRRLVLQTIAVAGGVVGLYLLVMLVNLPITARVIGQHILYDSPHFYVRATMALYLLGTCVTFDVLQPPMRRGVRKRRHITLLTEGCGEVKRRGRDAARRSRRATGCRRRDRWWRCDC